MARAAEDVVHLPGGHRVPPQNLEAEQSVLGAMMLSTDAMADVVEILEADDFYRSAHGRIYAALRDVCSRTASPSTRSRPSRRCDARASSTRSAARCTCATSSSRCPRAAGAVHYARDRGRRGVAAPADRRGRRHHRHGLRRGRRRRLDRRRRRAAHLRRRPSRGQGGDGGHRRPGEPGDDRPREHPEPRVGLHGDPHRLHATSTPSRRGCRRATWSSSPRGPASGSPRSR